MSQLILCLCILDNEILSYKSNDCKVWSHINIKGEAGYHHQSNIDNFNMVLGECNLSLNLDDELKDVHFCVVYKQQYAHFALALIENARGQYKNELFSCYPFEQVYKCYCEPNVEKTTIESHSLTYEWIKNNLLPILSFEGYSEYIQRNKHNSYESTTTLMRKQFDIEGRKDVIASTIKEAFIMNYDDHALFPVFKPIGLFKEQTFNKEKFLKLTERIPVDIQDKLSKVSPTIVKIEDFELSEDVNSILVGLGENIAEEVVNTVKGPCLGNIARSSGILIEKESVDIIYQDFSSLVSVTHDDCLDFLKKLNAYSTLFNFDSLYKYLNAHLLRFINLSLDTPLVEFDYANDAKELTAYYNKQVETSDSDLSEKFKRCAVIWDTIIPTMIRDYFLHKEEVMVTTEEGEKEVNSIDTLINFLYVDFPASKLPIGTATKPGKFSYVRKTNSPVLYNFFDKVYVNTKFRTLIICSDYTVIEVLSDLINRDTYYFGVVSE